ncbi:MULTISPECIES: hypothetical protein [Paracoccaceae]|uniref:hypothetical protein n=1 Tax=Paracoccaceae TaxID=31989 RepID=UPI003298B399
MTSNELSVLVVDDDPLFTEALIRQQKRSRGPHINITCANSVSDAIEMSGHLERIDFLVVDYNLDNQSNAFDLLQAYRLGSVEAGSEDFTQTIPIAISSNEDFESLAKSPDFYKKYSEFSITSYISKREANGFRSMEREVIKIYESYLHHLNAINKKFTKDVKLAAESITLRAFEIERFVILVDRFARSRRDDQTSRYCHEIQSRNSLSVKAVGRLSGGDFLEMFEKRISYFDGLDSEGIVATDLISPGKHRKRLSGKVEDFFTLMDRDAEAEAKAALNDCLQYASRYDGIDEVLSAITWQAGQTSRDLPVKGVATLSLCFDVLRRSSDQFRASSIAAVCGALLKKMGKDADAKQFLRFVGNHRKK